MGALEGIKLWTARRIAIIALFTALELAFGFIAVPGMPGWTLESIPAFFCAAYFGLLEATISFAIEMAISLGAIRAWAGVPPLIAAPSIIYNSAVVATMAVAYHYAYSVKKWKQPIPMIMGILGRNIPSSFLITMLYLNALTPRAGIPLLPLLLPIEWINNIIQAAIGFTAAELLLRARYRRFKIVGRPSIPPGFIQVELKSRPIPWLVSTLVLGIIWWILFISYWDEPPFTPIRIGIQWLLFIVFICLWMFGWEMWKKHIKYFIK